METLESLSRLGGAASEVDLVLQTLRTEGEQRRTFTRSVRMMIASMFLLVLANAVVDYLHGKSFDWGSLAIFGSLLGGSCAYGLTPGLRQAALRAANLSDKRLLGGMIEALDAGEPDLKATLENASAELLEQVTREDVGLLDDCQLDLLVHAVRLSANPRFRKAAIRALGLLGTSRTLQTLEVFLNDPSIPEVRRSILEPQIRATTANLRLRLVKERLAEENDRYESAMSTTQVTAASR